MVESRKMVIPITYMIQNMVAIQLDGLRKKGIHITTIIANTVGIQWNGYKKSECHAEEDESDLYRETRPKVL